MLDNLLVSLGQRLHTHLEHLLRHSGAINFVLVFQCSGNCNLSH
ncbi:hypothetical protein BOO71_0005209 [Deinococcus marmoris]|uniref:Uncharacterized protein n=1 Tax=Deinococcus marmoris TaxID=249408 RepID=A0A1U7P0D0_9DEIO|nr:hypothetical protein BOO71_0005209 [Deinococcus marmoris]